MQAKDKTVIEKIIQNLISYFQNYYCGSNCGGLQSIDEYELRKSIADRIKDTNHLYKF